MLKYAIWHWDNNKSELEEAIRTGATMNSCDYEHLVKLVIRHILNGKNRIEYYVGQGWSENIHVIDDGDYQGTLLFAIHLDTYQPSSYEYILTTVEYGSCSGCDALLSIQDYCSGRLKENQIKEMMDLCKDIVTSMVQPFRGRYGFDLDKIMEDEHAEYSGNH